MKALATAAPLAAALLAACASLYAADDAPARVSDGALTGPNGMTLYVFDKDTAGSGKSVCNGPCATNWPPLMAMASDKASGGSRRSPPRRGAEQRGNPGKPPYYWAKDAKPGDRTGDGMINAWHVARP